MKVESIMPDWAVDEINRLNKTISTIENNYLSVLEPYSSPKAHERILRQMKTDPTIQLCQRRIAEIHTYSVPTIIITAESEEDKERLEGILK